MSKLFLFLFFLLSIQLMAQEKLIGKIYTDTGVAPFIEVTNLSKRKTIYSNEQGNFSIIAQINDSIVFRSSFYEIQYLTVQKHHLKEIQVIQLKESMNQLDEVTVDGAYKNDFNTEEYTSALNEIIKEDIKKHPYKYGKSPSGGIDFIMIGKFVAGLFVKKKRVTKVFVPISFDDLYALFETNEYFNDEFLLQTLEIPIEKKFLFFDYCEGQMINYELLKTENKFLFVDTLVKKAYEFKKL
ncbi:peptidase associated/transthyretin-like domain-containing protein [Urechidicola sp. KH5]